MDPQAFIRLSVGSLGLRAPGTALNGTKSGSHAFSSPCTCEIRLRGFPVQTTSVPFVSSPEATPDTNSIASSFYLEESDLKALLTPGCFYTNHACLEVAVFTGHKGTHCGVAMKRQQVGTFRLEVGPEWGKGKPAVLFNGWTSIGKNKQENGKPGAELHLRVKLDPDPRYVFQFEEKTKLSPQIVQLQGNIKQPIFSCKFSQDRSNPGAWLIVRPDPCMRESWQPWGKLEAWRERGIRDSICCRFHLLSDGPEGGGDLLMSEILISAEKGGEFYIDTDKQVRAAASPVPSPRSSESAR
nr:Nuclear factor 1 A-type isoform 2 [Ipomoea batatas]